MSRHALLAAALLGFAGCSEARQRLGHATPILACWALVAHAMPRGGTVVGLNYTELLPHRSVFLWHHKARSAVFVREERLQRGSEAACTDLTAKSHPDLRRSHPSSLKKRCCNSSAGSVHRQLAATRARRIQGWTFELSVVTHACVQEGYLREAPGKEATALAGKERVRTALPRPPSSSIVMLERDDHQSQRATH